MRPLFIQIQREFQGNNFEDSDNNNNSFKSLFYLKLSLSLRLLQFFHTLICLNTTKGKECPKMAESSQQMQPNQAVKKGENMNNFKKNNTKYRMSLMDGIKILMCPRHFSSSFLQWTNGLQYIHISKLYSFLSHFKEILP